MYTSDCLLYEHATVLTLDEARPHAEAILVRDGRVVATGTAADFAGVRAKRIDLEGRFVCPAFADAHVHPVMGGLIRAGQDLRDVGSRAELRERLERLARPRPPHDWIRARNYRADFWTDGQPDRHDLDAACGGRPVLIVRTDGHVGVASTRALEMAGITPGTPDPAGGVTDRDAAGQPTGVLRDAALDPVWRVVPSRSAAEAREGLLAAMAEAAANGVGTLHAILSPAELDALLALRAEAGPRGLRARFAVYVGAGPAPWPQRLTAIAEQANQSRRDPWVAVRGVKFFCDGALGSRTARFAEPYLDNPPGQAGYRGVYTTAPEELATQVRATAEAGLQPAVHAIGDQAVHDVLDLLERLPPAARAAARPRIEHAQHLLPGDEVRFAGLGVTASVQPRHLFDDGDICAARLGPERARRTYVLRTLLAAGARLAFGSDWPVAEMSPLLGVAAAVTRRTRRHTGGDSGWEPQERITVAQALRAYTVEAAWAESAERDKGRLAPGYLADFVALSGNPLTGDPAALPDMRVDMTVVGGRAV